MANFNITIEGNVYGVDLVNDMPHQDLNTILEFVHSNNSLHAKKSGFERLGSGSYGFVYGYKEYAVKTLFDGEFDDAECNDIAVLKDLSHLSCIPTLYAVIDNRAIIIERIKGETVRDFCIEDVENENITLDERFVEKWDKYLLEVVANGYSPRDLHESNMMIEEHTNEPKFVDVGWFTKHGRTYDVNDVESMKCDRGYELAHSYSGNTLDSHIAKQKSRKSQLQEV